jgi:hypothetical protein
MNAAEGEAKRNNRDGDLESGSLSNSTPFPRCHRVAGYDEIIMYAPDYRRSSPTQKAR